MRCGCPQCGAYMIQSDGIQLGCVCPQCGFRCRLCLGTDTVISKEQLAKLRDTEWFSVTPADEDCQDD